MNLARTHALVLGLLTGCVADPVSGGDSLSGGSGSGGSDSGMDMTNGINPCTDSDISIDVANAYQAALNTGLVRVAEMEARFAAAVGEPEVEPNALAEFQAQITAGFEEVTVTTDWIACEFTDVFAAQSLALCGVTGAVQICEGPHACSGECTGALYEAGPIACEASCIGPCELEVPTGCSSWCSGTCSTAAPDDDFEGPCEAECEGECGVTFGSCEGTCAGGCYSDATALPDSGALRCAGECTGEPSECLGRVYTMSPNDMCNAIAEFAAVAGPSCEAPYVVYDVMFNAALSGDQSARDELSAFLADARPAVAELLAIEHQAQLMLDTLVDPPCEDPLLSLSHEQLLARLTTVQERAAAWALPAGASFWDSE